MKIYITDQGQIFGEHPEWKFPKEYSLTSEAETINARSHAILFEDHWNVIVRLPSIATDIKTGLRPGIYTVDLPEVERVEQYRSSLIDCEWNDYNRKENGPKEEDDFEYRTIYRFVERKEEKPEFGEVKDYYDIVAIMEDMALAIRILRKRRDEQTGLQGPITLLEKIQAGLMVPKVPPSKAERKEEKVEAQAISSSYSITRYADNRIVIMRDGKLVEQTEKDPFIIASKIYLDSLLPSESQDEQSHNFDDLMDFHRQGRSKTALLKIYTITRKP